MHLNGFDYAMYLKRHLMVGQVDPWRRTEEGGYLYALLVPFESAWLECKEWSGQDITKTELMNNLKINNIWVLRDVREFEKIKEELKPERKTVQKRKRHTKVLSEDRKEELRNRMKSIHVKNKSTEMEQNALTTV